jgi:arylformamidase
MHGPTRGSVVWLDLDQAELDAAYDQARHAANRAQVTGRYASDSARVRERLGEPHRFAYGPAPIETLDVYRTPHADAPINVFIHGGAWRNGRASGYAFMAELFVSAGAHLVVPDFSWVQDTGGSLLPIADQVQRAIAWVHRNARTFGGDPERIHVSAHSSGAHLAAVALTTDWPASFGLPAGLLKGGLLCSGIYDLEPVRLSSRSSYVTFTDEIEQALSPIRHIDRIDASLVLACGTLESPEFERQSRAFAAALQTAGKPVELLVAQHCNHFEVLETLANPCGLLGRAVLEQMGLNLGR